MKTCFVGLLLVLSIAALGSDQDDRVYEPVGAPADPKVAAHWNRYHDYGAATELMRDLAAAHPERCRLTSLGKSYGGREMWLLTITNPDTGDEQTKPAFWIDGGIHANEVQGTEVALYTAWFLLEMDGRNAFVTRLLDERMFYIVPMLSPDGRDAHMHEPNTTHGPRSGLRPVDDDRDGLVDEDPADDLDGDGHITSMRVADPNGRFKPHEEFRDMMVAVKEGERGEYTLLGQEGIDNDGDGKLNEDGDGFYDPNRGWPWQWQPEYVQGGAHRYPFSVEENRLVGEFIMSRPNIAGAQSLHNAGGMILRGPGTMGDEYHAADLRVYDVIGQRGATMLPGYRYLELRKDLYPAHGAELDWLYAMRGALSFTNELFTGFNFFRRTEGGAGGYFGSEATHQEFNKYLLLGEGLVKWHEVEHPTYGRVEVGGFKKTWLRQPPSFLLEEECHRNMAFCLYHADQMPRVRVQDASARLIGGDVVEVTAAIENTRTIPTRLGIDVQRKITPPNRVTIRGEGVEVIAGLVSEERFFVNPREQKRNPAEIRVETIGGHSVVYCRWLVRGEGPFTVTVKSIKGGSDALTVIVPPPEQ